MTQKTFPIRFSFGVAALVALLFIPQAAVVHAQEPEAVNQNLSPNQLDDLVAPIALYPDPLVSQILVAATYPLEIVQANQWLLRNSNLTGLALSQAAERQNWDPSVQALVPFSDVLKYLNEDISWTMNLGNAFLAQESDVMDAIQRMRAKAAQTGKLTSSAQLQVNRVYTLGHPVYEIVPVDPEIIYVPVYDPLWIWGPSYYYPYPRWYYAPHIPVVYFNRGISIGFYYDSGWSVWSGWNSWGWRPSWVDRRVVVNNTFIYRHSNDPIYRSNRNVATTWTHDSSHRQGVPYSTAAVSERYRGGSHDGSRTREVSAPVRTAYAPTTRSTTNSTVSNSQHSGGGGAVTSSPNTDRNRSGGGGSNQASGGRGERATPNAVTSRTVPDSNRSATNRPPTASSSSVRSGGGGGNSQPSRARDERGAPNTITSRNVPDTTRMATNRPPTSPSPGRNEYQSAGQGGGFARSQSVTPTQRTVQQPSHVVQPQRSAPQAQQSSPGNSRQSVSVRESAPVRSAPSSQSQSHAASQSSSSSHGHADSGGGRRDRK